MNFKKLDEDLFELIKKKMDLNALSYDNEEYDDVEEELHDMEDDFNEKYGEFLEEALQQVHDEFCPESDVLLPTAYIANTYVLEKDNRTGEVVVQVSPREGVLVEVEQYLNHETRIAFVPNPMRIVLNIDRKRSEIVWESE